MTTKMLRVKATRKFGHHRAGDELLVAEDAEAKLLVKHGYYELIAVEESKPDKPKAAKPKAKKIIDEAEAAEAAEADEPKDE